MRVEQALTLLDLKDDCFHIGDQTVIKRGNTLSFVASDDNIAFSKVINPYVKTAESVTALTVVMPSAISYDYSRTDLEKIASREKNDNNLNRRVQTALLKLSEEKRPMPTVDGIKTLAGIMNNGSDPDIVNLKFAQFGGHGNMTDSTQNNGSTGNTSGSTSSFDRWQAQITLDSMLDLSHRGDPKMGFYPTEYKLATCAFFNHQQADENAKKYDMTWTERLTEKNKNRLLAMLKQKAERDEREKNREPKNIRLDADNYSPRHYSGLEYWLEEKRGADADDYLPKRGRQEEWTPEWHEQLSTLRKHSNRELGLKILAYWAQDSDTTLRRPGRRNMDEDPYDTKDNPSFESLNEYMAGSSTPDQVGAYGDGREKSNSSMDVNSDRAEETAAFNVAKGGTILPDAYNEYMKSQADIPMPADNNIGNPSQDFDKPFPVQPKKPQVNVPLEKQLDKTQRKQTNLRRKYTSEPDNSFSPDAELPNSFGNEPGQGPAAPGASGRHMRN